MGLGWSLVLEIRSLIRHYMGVEKGYYRVVALVCSLIEPYIHVGLVYYWEVVNVLEDEAHLGS